MSKLTSTIRSLPSYSLKDSDGNVIRNTFGLTDKNRKPYLDILGASRQIRRMNRNQLYNGYIKEAEGDYPLYRIMVDNKLLEHFKTNDEAVVIISFQNRTTGLFAVCRLFKQWETRNGK